MIWCLGNPNLDSIEVFAGVKLYMACMACMAKLYMACMAKLYMACMAILRTGRTFYHSEIAQQQFYRAAQKFLTNCHAGPNGSEMGRVLQMWGMVVGGLVDGATGEV